MKKILFLVLFGILGLHPSPAPADIPSGEEYCEDYEKNVIDDSFNIDAFPPHGWEIESTHPALSWSRVMDPEETPFDRHTFAYVRGDGEFESDERLITFAVDPFDLFDKENCSGEFSTFDIDLQFILAASELSENVTFSVEICETPSDVNNQCTWKSLWLWSENKEDYFPYQWVTIELDSISVEADNPEFRLAFRFQGQTTAEIALDQVLVHLQGSCCEWIGGGSRPPDQVAKAGNGSICGISTHQSGTVLFVMMLVLGISAMAIGARGRRL